MTRRKDAQRMLRTVRAMIELNGQHLTIEQFVDIVKNPRTVHLSDDVKKRVDASRKAVESMIRNGHVAYGVNTGFGKLSDDIISEDNLAILQENLLKSHACGIGKRFDDEIVRGMMLLRVNALIKGYSGVRLKTVETLIEMLNKGVTPVVYEQGSLGASGDLVPLAHMALPLIGLGEAVVNGERLPAAEAMEKADIKPLDTLAAKEGLALINGTQAMCSVAAFALFEMKRLIDASHVSAALTFEALKGIDDVFHETVHEIRNQRGQIESARRMRALLEGSSNTTRQGEQRVQDAYALRCVPQVHGASMDVYAHVRDIVEREMNAMTDNPVIFPEGKALSAGNFHGQSVALALDYLAMAASELANISERRLERLVNPALNNGLPPFLTQKKGLHSGFMIVQYAAASLVSENKILCHPASVDSIPSSGNQEDHVSMGTISARKARTVLKHSQSVVAMEMFSAAQALDFRGKDGLSSQSERAYKRIRKDIPFIEEDTIMQPHIATAAALIEAGVFGEGFDTHDKE